MSGLTRRELLRRFGLAGAALAAAPLLPGMALAGNDEPEARAEPVELEAEPIRDQVIWYGGGWSGSDYGYIQMKTYDGKVVNLPYRDEGKRR